MKLISSQLSQFVGWWCLLLVNQLKYKTHEKTTLEVYLHEVYRPVIYRSQLQTCHILITSADLPYTDHSCRPVISGVPFTEAPRLVGDGPRQENGVHPEMDQWRNPSGLLDFRVLLPTSLPHRHSSELCQEEGHIYRHNLFRFPGLFSHVSQPMLTSSTPH